MKAVKRKFDNASRSCRRLLPWPLLPIAPRATATTSFFIFYNEPLIIDVKWCLPPVSSCALT